MKRILLSIICILFVAACFAEADISGKNTQLIKAVKEGDIQAARTALADGANISSKDSDKRSVLILAGYSGLTDIVKAAIEKGIDVT